jgi:hypothetical protein
MLRRVEDSEHDQAVVQSYLGLLRHGNAYRLAEQIRI